MANITVNTDRGTGLFHRLGTAMRLLGARYARYRVYRDTLAELQSLSERELADLGLSRSMLRRVAYHAAYE